MEPRWRARKPFGDVDVPRAFNSRLHHQPRTSLDVQLEVAGFLPPRMLLTQALNGETYPEDPAHRRLVCRAHMRLVKKHCSGRPTFFAGSRNLCSVGQAKRFDNTTSASARQIFAFSKASSKFGADLLLP